MDHFHFFFKSFYIVYNQQFVPWSRTTSVSVFYYPSFSISTRTIVVTCNLLSYFSNHFKCSFRSNNWVYFVWALKRPGVQGFSPLSSKAEAWIREKTVMWVFTWLAQLHNILKYRETPRVDGKGYFRSGVACQNCRKCMLRSKSS